MIDGDYAAWEMRVKGLGCGEANIEDSRLLKMHMRTWGEDGILEARLRKGCSYEVSMSWLRSRVTSSGKWYCWSAQVNGMPTEQTYHSGASSKDAGNKVCAINKLENSTMTHSVIDGLLAGADKEI